MRADRFDERSLSTGIGRVVAVNDVTWEVDIESEDGGLISRAMVIGPRLQQSSTGDRPQWCKFALAGNRHGRPVCWPIESRLPGERTPRKDVVYYDEVQNFRETITREGVWELRNSKGPLLQLRILEEGGVIRVDTPKVRAVVKDEDGSIDVHCDGDLTADVGGNASATVAGNIDVQAGGNVTVQAGGDIVAEAAGKVDVTAPQINLTGAVTITGSLDVV